MTKILVRYNEIYLKGNNRGMFERKLIENIRKQLDGFKLSIVKVSGRILIEDYAESDLRHILLKLTKLAGVYSVSVAEVVESDLNAICRAVMGFVADGKTFRITARRADKTFPMNSSTLAGEVGAYVLEQKPNLKVDLHTPQQEIFVEVRECKTTYIFSESIPCAGGLPVGCSGKGLLMLSGGIDSPVAGQMMAKRGMTIECVHFHSYPYTSELAKEKVLSLAKILKEYTLSMKVHVVPFTEIQDAIHEKCPAEYMVILMRRMMMRIANVWCEKTGSQTIITGENLAQVASQTIESLTVTNAVAGYPVMRPLIGFDKHEIIEAARKIGTYDTSILPYEDCCTVFLPEHPVIKPKLSNIERAELSLKIEELVARAVAGAESVVL